MNDYIAFVAGVTCAGIGGELFVRGAVSLAQWLRIAPGIIGATIAAFGSSSPELSVAINAALANDPQLALGDALGSNILNVAFILAIALMISGIQTSRDSIKRDFPVALLVPVITCVLCLDGKISRIDGFVMLSAFIIWLVMAAIEAKKQRNLMSEVIGNYRKEVVVLSCIGGLILLIIAGKLIVIGAKGIATNFGIDEFIVGAVIVAIGTSVPELAITVIAKFRGHDEISLGTILGSNIFNGLFIIPVAAIISPITINVLEVAVTLVFGMVAVALTFPPGNGLIERRRGVILLVLYSIYIATILQ